VVKEKLHKKFGALKKSFLTAKHAKASFDKASVVEIGAKFAKLKHYKSALCLKRLRGRPASSLEAVSKGQSIVF
jgi:hypothetical protein